MHGRAWSRPSVLGIIEKTRSCLLKLGFAGHCTCVHCGPMSFATPGPDGTVRTGRHVNAPVETGGRLVDHKRSDHAFLDVTAKRANELVVTGLVRRHKRDRRRFSRAHRAGAGFHDGNGERMRN